MDPWIRNSCPRSGRASKVGFSLGDVDPWVGSIIVAPAAEGRSRSVFVAGRYGLGRFLGASVMVFVFWGSVRFPHCSFGAILLFPCARLIIRGVFFGFPKEHLLQGIHFRFCPSVSCLFLGVQEYFPSVLALFCVPGCAFGCALVFLPPKDIFGFRSALSGGMSTGVGMARRRSEGVRAPVMPAGGVPALYSWVTSDVWGTPSRMTEADLQWLRDEGAVCGGGDAERHYEFSVPGVDERVCYTNLDSPTVSDWLWVYEVMFTRLGVRLPFSPFIQQLLSRCSVAPSQLHPNSWAAIRTFELVCEFLELLVSVNVFLFLFLCTLPTKEGKYKKGYMSFRAQPHRRVFGLYEDSFHGFKSGYFKVRPAAGHHPFWLTLEGGRRFPTYWNFGAGPSVLTRVTQDFLTAEDRDVALVSWQFFEERPLNPRDVMGDPVACRAYVVEIAGGLTTLARLKAQLSQGTSSGGTSSTPNSRPTDDTRVVAEDLVLTEGGTDGSGRGVEADDDVVVLSPEGASRKRKRSEDVDSENMVEGDGAVPSVVDRRFDAPAFIDEYLMPGTEDFFRLLDKKFRQSQAEVARLKGLLADAESARERAVKSSEESGAEILRLSEVETSLLSQLGEERRKASNVESWAAVLLADVGTLKGEVDGLKAEVVVLKEEKAVLLADVKEVVAATEETMRAQALVLVPGADVSVMGAFKTVRDDEIVDLE
ncbi:uncharacterized protein DS421_14g462850 [Arachis hypogaea]|nr:uncharacterized protein DS421_14g462850 [Arachis hypogaea]